jgi:DNA-binding transcriptional LysR family regulator
MFIAADNVTVENNQMDLSLKSLRCFVAVAELKSFTRAAAKVHMTQPSLSAQIRQLEAWLGFRLFVRSTRNVELTEAGAMFLKQAQRVIEEGDRLARTVANIRQPSNDRLRLGAAVYTTNIAARRALTESFEAIYPSVELSIANRSQQVLVGELEAGNLDALLLIGVPVSREQYKEALTAKKAELLYPADLPSCTIASKCIALSMTPDHPLAGQTVVAQQALHGHRIAMLDEFHGEAIVTSVTKMLKDAGGEPVVPPEANAFGVERYGERMRLPAISLGWFDDEGDGRRMVRRNVEGLQMETHLVVLSTCRPHTSAVSTFLDYARTIETRNNS